MYWEPRAAPMQRWAAVADIEFLETSSGLQTISPQNAGDRINLITVSDQNSVFISIRLRTPAAHAPSTIPGGAIVEADIALNPNVLFSSDGTVGTYDLESTLHA